nr:hypothetical protein [Allomuricauda sp.]
MASNFNTSLEILEAAQRELLYEKLVTQLEKDFKLANIPVQFGKQSSPENLQKLLHEKTYFLLMEKFPEYLNLLYVIDIPEKQMSEIKSNNPVDVAAEVSFVILKREWQKVWFKERFSS